MKLEEIFMPGRPELISVHVGVKGVGFDINKVFRSNVCPIHILVGTGGNCPANGGVSKLIVIVAISSKQGALLAVYT